MNEPHSHKQRKSCLERPLADFNNLSFAAFCSIKAFIVMVLATSSESFSRVAVPRVIQRFIMPIKLSLMTSNVPANFEIKAESLTDIIES